MATAVLQWKITDGIGWLTLSAPPYNYTTEVFFNQLDGWLAQLPDAGVKGIVISSSGRHFSAGAKLAELKSWVQGGSNERLKYNLEVLQRLKALPVPVIAALRGVCIGSGLEVALHCHYRIAALNLMISLPEVSFGLIPGAGGLVNGHKLAGMATILKLALAGDSLDAEAALRAGLINEICPLPNLELRVAELLKSR